MVRERVPQMRGRWNKECREAEVQEKGIVILKGGSDKKSEEVEECARRYWGSRLGSYRGEKVGKLKSKLRVKGGSRVGGGGSSQLAS